MKLTFLFWESPGFISFALLILKYFYPNLPVFLSLGNSTALQWSALWVRCATVLMMMIRIAPVPLHHYLYHKQYLPNTTEACWFAALCAQTSNCILFVLSFIPGAGISPIYSHKRKACDDERALSCKKMKLELNRPFSSTHVCLQPFCFDFHCWLTIFVVKKNRMEQDLGFFPIKHVVVILWFDLFNTKTAT